MQAANSIPAPAPRQNRSRAVAFFLVLFLLGVGAVVVPIVYNLSLQLTPEQVERARQRWQAVGKQDYDLLIQVRANTDDKTTDYKIEVRGGRFLGATCNGEPDTDPATAHYTVEGLLEHIAATLRDDIASGGKRIYTTADFDTRDGHPRRYVRRVPAARQRTEWIIRLAPPDDQAR